MPHPDNLDQWGTTLLALARAAIAGEFGVQQPAKDSAGWLDQPGATFVTLTQEGTLRGCIGSLEAWRPLRIDVRSNAKSAAFHDPRFRPLARAELSRTSIEVSLLSPMQPIEFTSHSDVLAQLRPTIDGVVLEYGAHRSTFLPQVWDQLPDPSDFMAALKRKAGLPMSFWHDDIRLQRYHVTVWHEQRPDEVTPS